MLKVFLAKRKPDAHESLKRHSLPVPAQLANFINLSLSQVLPVVFIYDTIDPRIDQKSRYPSKTMSSTKSSSRARPAVSAPPNSPRTEENQGYRRGRAIRSCLECRRRKMRCNRSRPCQNCNRFCRDCVYLPFPDWPSGASINVKAENSSQSPEQGVGRAIPSYASAQRTGLIQTSPFTHNHDHSFDPDTLAHHDGFYDSDADDQPLEVGLQIGRLCITERMNGFFRPQVANQITALLSQPARSVPPYDPQTSYGEPSNRHPAQPTQTAASPHYVVVERVSPLEPSPSLLATAAQSFLPQSRLELPTREELQLLCYQYWSAVDPLAHIVHKPSFEEERRKYLPHGQLIDTTPASFRALLLAMCLAAAVSLPLTQAERVLGVTQQTLVGRLKNATEKALADASFMNSVKIQTLQAFTVYMIPQCRAEISRSHTVYVGALIRLARGAGLNRDASVPEMDPVDCQVRRLLWHQIGFLELSTAEAQGTQPAVYDNDFNTPLPLNIQDDALGRPNNDSVSASFWTDATLSIIRSECCMLHRLVIGQRLRFENGQTDLKTVQHLVNVHKTRIERQYLQNLDEAIPIQRCAMLIGQIFNARCDAILLHRHSRFDVNTGLQTDVREAYVHLLTDRACSSSSSNVLILTRNSIGSSNPALQYARAPPHSRPTRSSHLGLGTPEHTTDTNGPSSSLWKSTATPIAPTSIASTASSTTSSE